MIAVFLSALSSVSIGTAKPTYEIVPASLESRFQLINWNVQPAATIGTIQTAAKVGYFQNQQIQE